MTMLRLLIDGREAADIDRALPAQIRALHYGDGLFETMLGRNGGARLFEFHMERLADGCRRLGIPQPDVGAIAGDLQRAIDFDGPSIAKLLVARGGAGRGYKPDLAAASQRCLFVYSLGSAPCELTVRWCESRYARNRQLAGLKHLNRLEQVLAQAEFVDDENEGLMLDTEDQVVSATAGNVFVVTDGVVTTPDLTHCGIEGVMRRFVLERARALDIPIRVASLSRSDIESADEVFVTNAVRGVRPVVRVGLSKYDVGPATRVLKTEVEKL